MNEILKDFNGKFLIVFLDDILIFSKTNEEHLEHIDIVLRRLHQDKWEIKLEKCLFMQEEMKYLGFVISQGRLKMDKEKLSVILS